MKIAVKIMPILGLNPEALGRNKDINVKRIAEVEQVVTTRIGITPYYRARQQAARCHVSQTGGRGGGLTGYLGKWLFPYDTFSRAVPPFEGGMVERDLFAGIDEVPESGM